MSHIRVFRYIDVLDAFVVTDEYRRIADRLGLIEWNPVVWIGRLFAMDNDFGEHWFDNFEERQAKEIEAAKLGLDSENACCGSRSIQGWAGWTLSLGRVSKTLLDGCIEVPGIRMQAPL